MNQETHEAKNTYLVPGKVPTRTEIFPGIGWSELALVAVALVVGLILSGLLGIPQTQRHVQTVSITGQVAEETVKTEALVPLPMRLVVIVAMGGGAFMLVQRTNGSSILSMIVLALQFSKSKRRYNFRSRRG
jgi:hypothetical protein